ncbi:hypothetical protein BASA50_004916 [Batrachochytrium salamandrivorans]|uniref:Phosphoacetylglucosamine mutase n=1 Tax=Batrachochytrium salamandrivorans TaxID=1357716 RepID=A0ABQ8F8K1_9FUNG|nr:hypothetical protein BASA50_007282 [Batrachochytrium salamandrivorans]KAH6596770.1 hypothetical protein BASA50_004916 [Batrachochytrium salamandrivorans]
MIIPTLPVATIAAVVEGAASHPRPDHRFTYGTAGFRMNAQLLDSVMFRVGLLAALRSMCLEGKTVGVMVTASHNPAQDNGVKLVEPLGEMLDQEWEVYAMDLANAATDDALVAAMQAIVDTQTIGLRHTAAVVVARDTRPSGAALVDSLMHGIRSMGGFVTDFGLMTTPQLHYVTRCINTAGTPEAYGEPTAQGYYSKLANSFTAITKGTTLLSTLHVDCANGIGAPALREFLQVLGDDHFKVEIVNGDTANSEKLNYNCGADFVKLHQKAPEGLTMAPGQRWCSYDGDADRIVFYYCDINGRFKLLDGDKIATLAAEFIMGLIRTANVVHIDGSPLKAGLVQTAYANGSSTSYVKDTLKVPVVFTPTGVKHLHHAAEHFDVGVYFEANGHGTVLFSKQAIQRFNATDGKSDAEVKALHTLRILADLINQTVGDALSDMLMVETVLLGLGRSFESWDQAYTDLPSRQEKVKVQDRTLFVPINADTELSEPAGLQDRINQQTTKFAKGRCFVRPSGTEDIVRVYAEAATTEETEMLANVVCGIVFDDYGGIGERPAKYLKVGATETITH